MALEEIRAFIAVELPDRIKLSLSTIQAELKANKARAQWVAPNSIHLTLKFLGDISVASIPDVTRVMEEAAFGIAGFRLAVRGLGVFPDVRRMRVVWAGVTGDTDVLARLQKGLDLELAALGFAPESRPFTAHLTLARLRDDASPADRQNIGRLVSQASFEAGDFEVESVNLMRSQLTREGAIYTRLATISLERA